MEACVYWFVPTGNLPWAESITATRSYCNNGISIVGSWPLAAICAISSLLIFPLYICDFHSNSCNLSQLCKKAHVDRCHCSAISCRFIRLLWTFMALFLVIGWLWLLFPYPLTFYGTDVHVLKICAQMFEPCLAWIVNQVDILLRDMTLIALSVPLI